MLCVQCSVLCTVYYSVHCGVNCSGEDLTVSMVWYGIGEEVWYGMVRLVMVWCGLVCCGEVCNFNIWHSVGMIWL